MKWIIIAFIVIFIIYKIPLYGEIPEDMKIKIRELSKNKNDLEFAQAVYSFVNEKYTSPVRQYFKEPEKFLQKDLRKIWENKGYYPSHTQNEIFKIMLIESGRFKEEDFKFVQSYCYEIPLMFHEYYILDVDEEKVFIDLWLADNTVLNNSFGCYSPPPCVNEKFICAEGYGGMT